MKNDGNKRIKIGIYGIKRGGDLGRAALMANADVVAICDTDEMRVNERRDQFIGAKCYTSFDEFIEHPMDAIILANYFHEHTPYAIKALERNISVLSECTSNSTMAEGVALVRQARILEWVAGPSFKGSS